MDKILSLIIPSYNMEDYLRYCLDSLLVSDSVAGLLEVLVVNDGSKDRTSEIAHAYEAEHPGIFKVIDKKNGNYGSCVNIGLTMASGKYVKVLDADDSFDTSSFEEFLVFLQNNDADLVLSDFAVVDPERNVRKIIRYDLGDGSRFDMDSVCTGHVFKSMQMHAVTYRRENLMALHYRQSEGISYTDQQWIFIPMVAVRTVVCFDKYVYKYLIGRTGQTVNPAVKVKSIAQTIKCSLDMARSYEIFRDKFQGMPVQKYLMSRITPMLKEVYVFAMTHYDISAKEMLSDFDESLSKASPELYGYIGSREISSFMGFEYISYWRKHKDACAFMVRTISAAYLLALRLKKSRAGDDPMHVPVS